MISGQRAAALKDAPWLASGPLARLLGVLNSDGEEARIVGQDVALPRAAGGGIEGELGRQRVGAFDVVEIGARVEAQEVAPVVGPAAAVAKAALNVIG